MGPAAGDTPVPAPDYNITLVTDSAPDFTDLPSYLRSITSQWKTPQEKAIAIWRWSHLLRKQTSVPSEGGEDVRDPILFFTSYGYTNCGIISGVNNTLWLNMGWQARYDQLGDHTVSECSWDGGKTWHMFDDSMSFYCFNDRGEVASTPEIKAHPEYYLRNFATECGTNPVRDEHDPQGWRQASDHPVEFERTLANGVQSFLGKPELNTDHLAIQWGRTHAITLRPGEVYQRDFFALDHPGDITSQLPLTARPLHGKDVEDGELRGCVRGNGIRRYEPDLVDPATRELVYACEGVAWTRQGVRGPGQVTFKVAAADVITSAEVTLDASRATLAVSTDAGRSWHATPVDRRRMVGGDLLRLAGETEYLMRVNLEAGGLLSRLVIRTTTQVNRPSLPGLHRGANRVQVRLGDQVETITLAPPLAGSRYKESVAAESGVTVNASPYFNVATIAPAESGTPCTATWRIDAPTPITAVEYGGNVCVKAWDGNAGAAALLHSWDGRTFAEDFRKADAALPFDLVERISAGPVPSGARSVWLRYQFETAGDPRKLWQSPGFGSALMQVHHAPRMAGFTPIVVTYDWVEHRASGDIERQHTAVVRSPRQEYAIQVGGYRDPDMRWVRMGLLDAASPPAGYSDGDAAAPAESASRATYRWGRNLALGRTYTLTGDQDDRNTDGGRDLTDGIIAPPETYVSAKWMPTNVIFKPGATLTITIDLGAERTVAAVRVHAGQAADFHLTFPESIVVETSRDGRTFARTGSAGFNQVFDPPADFASWELEDADAFQDLPAGGRLAFAYRVLFEAPVRARFVRVTCVPRTGWGSMLSELQVFDAVSVDHAVPPAVTLSP